LNRPGEARRLAGEAARTSLDKDLVMAAVVHVALNDRDRAFALLEDGVARRLVEPNMVPGPELDPLRGDPRFVVRLVGAMQLPPASVAALVSIPWAVTSVTQNVPGQQVPSPTR
jgi:hypothetical protein